MVSTNRAKNEMLRGQLRTAGRNRSEKERTTRHKKLFGTNPPKTKMGLNRRSF